MRTKLQQKPHIYMKDGVWRVSKKTRQACRRPEVSKLWDYAYDYIRKLNLDTVSKFYVKRA